jgi:hypothetical protein
LGCEGIVERAVKHAFVCGTDPCAQLASCLGPQSMECHLQQSADAVVAITEVRLIALVERVEVSAWPADRGIPAAERVCDFPRGEAVASFEGGDLPVCRGGHSADHGCPLADYSAPVAAVARHKTRIPRPLHGRARRPQDQHTRSTAHGEHHEVPCVHWGFVAGWCRLQSIATRRSPWMATSPSRDAGAGGPMNIRTAGETFVAAASHLSSNRKRRCVEYGDAPPVWV